MKKFCFFLIFILTSSLTLNAKNDYAKASELLNDANTFSSKAKYNESNEKLLKALEYYPEYWEAYEKMGFNYKMLGDLESRIISYENAILFKNYAPRILVFLVEAYLVKNDLSKAKDYAELYLKQKNTGTNSEQYCKLIIQNYNFVIEAKKNPVPFNPKNLGTTINTSEHEYFPYLNPDGKTLAFTRMTNRNEDLFYALKNKNGFENAISFGSSINSNLNDGACAMSADGRFLIITACDRKEGVGSCDLYISERNNNTWSKPKNLETPVNTTYWEAHPTFSADGKTLYFSSNRPGGFGGRDIWSSNYDNGKWSAPINLGAKINTAFDDQCPFIHADNQTLYFTSNGWPGMGNADIYISRKTDTGWTLAENIGYPINTENDDNGMTVSYDGKIAFLASTREGTLGGLDIFSFELPEKAKPEKITYIKANIKDKITKEPIEANYSITDLDTKKEAYKGITTKGLLYVSIKANKNYALEIQKENYLFYSQNINLKESTSQEPYELEVLPEPISVNSKMVLNNVFFDFDKDILKEESFVELDKVVKLMQQNPNLKIELSGHTDSKGDDKYNQVLSQKRAEAVVNYLIKNGIAATRLIAKGYGETQPVAANDTDANRALNRRTELKIIGN